MESKSNYHIVTPFYRKENLHAIITNVQGFCWHAVEEGLPNFKDPAYAKINHFIQKCEIVDNDYYQILNDDDALPLGFFEVQKAIAGDIVIFSMKRGDHVPAHQNPLQTHPTTDLIATRNNMRIGGMGLQQIRFKGSIFKTLVCKDNPFADGMLIETLRERQDIVFVPNVYILFNYLEPGRYENTKN